MPGIFDTSIISSEKTISKEDLVKELVSKVEIILRKEFPGNPTRQRVKIHKDRISFAAPCCGDSATDDRKKRGNIILEGRFKNMYKCHNCGVSMSLSKFFKKYGQTLSLEAISYVTDTYSELSRNSSTFTETVYDVEEVEKYALGREWFKTVFGLTECTPGTKAYNYLMGRRQYSFDKFLYNAQHELLFILNLTAKGNIIGMQVRHLSENYGGPKYKTYSLSKIYETFLKTNGNVPDDVDELSMIFNILCVDITKTVTVLEGPMDSFLISNAIALCGGGKKVTFPFKCRYLFDSDKDGRKHALEYMEAGNEVFLWEKYKRDNGVPDKKKWDVNDLYIWAAKNNVKLARLDNYFSDDTLDMIDV